MDIDDGNIFSLGAPGSKDLARLWPYDLFCKEPFAHRIFDEEVTESEILTPLPCLALEYVD